LNHDILYSVMKPKDKTSYVRTIEKLMMFLILINNMLFIIMLDLLILKPHSMEKDIMHKGKLDNE
jgi:hypothetical protein